MSAFIVSHDHIDAIVTYAVQKRMSYWNPGSGTRTTIDRTNAEEIGRILLHENERSVRHRYDDCAPDDLPGMIGGNAATYSYRPFFSPRSLSAVQCIKAVHCLEYQSCEHPGWEASLARRICAAIKDRAIHALPGYDDAGWELSRETAI